VARAGYDAMMRGQDLEVPGLWNKLVGLAVRLTPRRLLIWFSRKTIE
jgi:short-subunit dehydrogenase